MQPVAQLEITTIGYEGLSVREFFDLLIRCKVEKLVDVRELAISRKNGFSKSALMQESARRGLLYRHFPELGSPRGVRHSYRESGDWAKYTFDFRAYLNAQAAGMELLADEVEKHRSCLMCFEEDFNFCHRTYVAENLAAYVRAPLRISHLTGPMKGRVAVVEPVPLV